MNGQSSILRYYWVTKVYWGIGVCLIATVGCAESSSTPLASVASSGAVGWSEDSAFATPVRFTSPEGPVRVEAPGYASPCWADLDGDGTRELLVGQFNSGKIRVFKSLGDQQIAKGEWQVAEGEWLQAGGSVAQVPGIW